MAPFCIGYLPILDKYLLININSEYGCFIGLDVRFPFYKVLEMDAQSIEDTWSKVNDYPIELLLKTMVKNQGLKRKTN